VVGQIARIKEAGRVIGIAGSDEKCAWLVKELGFDGAVNYRSEDVRSRLAILCPQGIDLYFDNVGGPLLDVCLEQLALRGRVVLCGAISTYNSPNRVPGPSNYRNLIVRRGRMEGFVVLDYTARFPEAQLQLATWLAEGRIQHREHVVEGLTRAPEALNLLFTGGNQGKVIVRL
jgi:NADPH-dependent curcumin reductase CurA